MQQISGPSREDGLFTSRPCQAVPEGKKFYMYDFEAVRHCSLTHNETFRAAIHEAMLGRGGQSFDLERLGPTVFFEQQLAEHPWRTMEPDEADLFVLPTVLDLAAAGFCNSPPVDLPLGTQFNGRMNQVLAAKLMAQAVQESRYYRRKAGADHLLFFVHLEVRGALFYKTQTADQEYVQDKFRNFIIAEALSRKYHLYGQGPGSVRPLGLPPSSSCLLTVPFFAPSATKTCSSQGGASDGGKRMVCEGAATENSIEEYLEHRNISYSFVGTPRNAAYPNMRDVVIRDFGPVRPPNILVYTTKPRRKSNIPLPPCTYSSDGIPQPSPCEARGRVEGAGMGEFLKRSRFSIHVKGADSGSSRVFDSIFSGSLQISIADLYMEDSAAFKCRVPWDRMLFHIRESDLRGLGAETTFRAALEALEADDYKRMREMLELQQAAVPELLWHVPGSRAGQNVIEDALRCASTPAIAGEMPLSPIPQNG